MTESCSILSLHRIYIFNPLSASHNYCRLLCLLPVTLKVIVANSVDPDQTAPLGAVWSGSTLFAYMQNVSLKSLQEDAADDISRRHFLGALRVKTLDTLGGFSAILDMGGNVCDFLFVFTLSPLYERIPYKERMCSCHCRPLFRSGQNNFTELPLLIVYPAP